MFFSFFVTCLPPVYPNSFRGFALYAIWIGQGFDVSLARPTSSAKSWLICSCRFSLSVKDAYTMVHITSTLFATIPFSDTPGPAGFPQLFLALEMLNPLGDWVRHCLISGRSRERTVTKGWVSCIKQKQSINLQLPI
jgi:hypothetical protein